MTGKIGVAVIGLGVGEQHARGFLGNDHCELRWLYDPVDYLRPGLLTFDIKAPYWATGGSPTRPAGTCKRAR